MIHLQTLLDDAKCYDKVRELRWPDGVRCPHCGSATVIKQGRDATQPARQKYRCMSCGPYFDDLTGTVLAGHHPPVQVWILCLYLMGLNLSNAQIAQALGLNKDGAQGMVAQLRAGMVAAQLTPELSGTVECDEVYIVAGHKGHPGAVKKGRQGRQRRLGGARGRGTLEKEKSPILGMIQRDGGLPCRTLVSALWVAPQYESCFRLLQFSLLGRVGGLRVP